MGIENKTFISKIKSTAPSLIGWVSIFAAVWSLLEIGINDKTTTILEYIRYSLAVFNIYQGASIFTAITMFIYAGAAFRHKRLVIILFTISQIFSLLIDIFVLVSIKTSIIIVGPSDEGIETYLITNACVTFFLLLFALWVWKQFPSKVNSRAAKTGLLIIILGELIIICGAVLIQTIIDGGFKKLGNNLLWILESALGIGEFSYRGTDIIPTNLALSHFVTILSGIVVLISFRAFLIANSQSTRSREEDSQLHELLSKYPTDSLSYFSTGTNRGIIFSTNKQAAITYSVASGVALAGGDPIGDQSAWDDAIKQWLKFTYDEGLVPAVISATEKGARAYKNTGFFIRSLGDEAIIDVPFFDTNANSVKALLAAKRRVLRANVQIQCRRLSAISDEELQTIRTKLNEYRSGDERGFSMSLDRILNPLDFNQMVVTAYNEQEELEGILTFVPWGTKGLSLNLMRRNPNSINGVIEAMILTLIDNCKDENIDKISLNFATLRNVFVEGDAVDATIGKKILRKIMLLASKFWQLESLYESNARYQPNWQPRYLAFRSGRLTSTLLAAAQLEGYFPRFTKGKNQNPSWVNSASHTLKVKEIYEQNLKLSFEPNKLGDQQKIRHEKAEQLMLAGMHPYPPADTQIKTTEIKHILEKINENLGKELTVHARIISRRKHGKLTFIDLCTGTYQLQILLDENDTQNYNLLKYTDIGDIISVTGSLGYSDTKELTIFAKTWSMLAKTLRPVVTSRHKLDKNTATRDRAMQFINQPRSIELLRMRSAAFAGVRSYLTENGYLEVETPMLHAVKGGANARPFVTHMNAYNYQVTLRIAPELYLKRLIVGGIKAVFEMGRSFRNEGVDATHNPEFTSLEAYKVHADYNIMRELTENLIRSAMLKVHGKNIVWQPKKTVDYFIENRLEFAPVLEYVENIKSDSDETKLGDKSDAYTNVFETAEEKMVQVDLSKPWLVVKVLDAVSNVLGQTITMQTPQKELLELANSKGLELQEDLTVAQIINEVYEEMVEPNTGYPTFYTDFPAEGCPLTRKHRDDDLLAERWDLVAFGMEIGTAYTELSDPKDQRERFVAQSLAAAAGDPEAMSLDEDFLDSLELGFAPTGGMGMGMDRMVMLICGTNIRDIIAFPFVKPNN